MSNDEIEKKNQIWYNQKNRETKKKLKKKNPSQPW